MASYADVGNGIIYMTSIDNLTTVAEAKVNNAHTVIVGGVPVISVELANKT